MFLNPFFSLRGATLLGLHAISLDLLLLDSVRLVLTMGYK